MFVLPNLGKESILTVNIVTNQGVKTSKTKKFSGSDIDFLWEANTSVPAGYKGKALAGEKSFREDNRFAQFVFGVGDNLSLQSCLRLDI